MRISDWSSDVCSSDLLRALAVSRYTPKTMVNPPADLAPEGRFVGREHRFALRVYFEDTDLSGVVYLANYLRYMERARSDMLRLAGIDQRAAGEEGRGPYAISECTIGYRAPAPPDAS